MGRFSMCLILSLTTVWPLSSVHADEIYGLAQMTCAPEIRYFAIRRFQLVNLQRQSPYDYQDPAGTAERLAALQQRYGIYDTMRLMEKPAYCEVANVPAKQGSHGPIPGFRISVTGLLDTNNGLASSYRNMRDEIEVFVDDRSIGKLFMNPYGFMAGSIDSIEVFSSDSLLQSRICFNASQESLEPLRPCAVKELESRR